MKTWIRLSLWLIPFQFPFMVFYCTTSIVMLFGGENTTAKYLAGEMNTDLICVLSVLALISVAINLNTLLFMNNYTADINRMDKAIAELEEEKRLYKLASDRLISVATKIKQDSE